MSLRLAKARKARLLDIAKGLPPGATPTDAIDRALELALAPRTEGGQLEDLEFVLEAHAAERRLDADRLQAALAAAARDLAEALALLRSAVEGED
ncbi:MAG: hypothetical protein V4505_25385 [Pseudomonadota bacterium]